LSVLAALCAEPSAWQHGYAIARDTGLKSGTLYPILIRLADRGLMEARWEDEQPAGRPRRHLYRLTPEGLASATAALAYAPPPVKAQAPGWPVPATTAQYAGVTMSELTRPLTALLRRSAALVPAAHREWAEAIWAEVAEVPAGWQRLGWRVGCG